jgi:hypothetical protein
MKATVYVEETISRIVEVNIPDGVHPLSYIEDYIHGSIENSYDWDSSDITEDNTIIVDYDLHKD